MRIKNTTPFALGYKVTSRTPPALEMATIVRGTFVLRPDAPAALPEGIPALVQGFLAPETHRAAGEEAAGECVYPGDFADFKLNAEVMLRGTCHAPGGVPAAEVPVRFAVGGWSKILRVSGLRAWSDSLPGAVMSDPRPFTSMPVNYAHSFGGPGHAQNPAGKGAGTQELPNVEHASELVRSHGDRPAPAGFGPLSSSWPQRSSKLGKAHSASYRGRSPGYVEGFDWTYFHAAPEDQQLPGYLRGDEEVVLQNLHRGIPVYRARLPGIKVRAFVMDVHDRFREVRMALDTLFVDADAESLMLTWRGLTGVEDDDLADVRTLLIGSEPLGAPLPEGHYREVIERFERDPLEIKDRLPPSMHESADWAMQQYKARRAKPVGSAAADSVSGAGSGAAATADSSSAPGAGAGSAKGGIPDPISALLKERLGGLAAAEQARIAEAVGRMLTMPLPGGVDLRGRLEQAMKERGPSPTSPVRGDVGTPAAARDPRIGATLRSARERLAKVKQDAAARGIVIPGLDALDRLVDEPKVAEIAPAIAAPEARAPEAPGPGRDLSGSDLSGQDLGGRDLGGARLDGAILARTNLKGARLAGARLRKAVLAGADLSGADLSGADMTGANAQGARAAGADLSRATLDRALFERADLSGARLDGATGAQAIFSRADMTGASARGAKLHKAFFEDTRIEGADLSGAQLDHCLLARAAAARAHFEGATLSGSSFSGADLTEARFGRARGERTVWLGATLHRADLRGATLPEAHFTEASAAGARMTGADLRGARFYRASLRGASIDRANLFEADLSRADLTGVKFNGSNLYGARLVKTTRTGCDLAGANVKRSTLERDE